jgi:hypothetical protein
MKLFMMPHTVPNRPINGAVAPMLASMPAPRVMRRPVAASIRSCHNLRPVNGGRSWRDAPGPRIGEVVFASPQIDMDGFSSSVQRIGFEDHRHRRERPRAPVAWKNALAKGVHMQQFG